MVNSINDSFLKRYRFRGRTFPLAERRGGAAPVVPFPCLLNLYRINYLIFPNIVSLPNRRFAHNERHFLSSDGLQRG